MAPSRCVAADRPVSGSRLLAGPRSSLPNRTNLRPTRVPRMPEAGLEPALGCPNRILSPARLPFRHSGLGVRSELPMHDRTVHAPRSRDNRSSNEPGRRRGRCRTPVGAPRRRGGGRAIPGAGRGEEDIPTDSLAASRETAVGSRASCTSKAGPPWPCPDAQQVGRRPPSNGVKPANRLDKRPNDHGAAHAATDGIRCARATIDRRPAHRCKAARHCRRPPGTRPPIDLSPSSRQCPGTGTGGAPCARHGEEDACISSCTGCSARSA